MPCWMGKGGLVVPEDRASAGGVPPVDDLPKSSPWYLFGASWQVDLRAIRYHMPSLHQGRLQRLLPLLPQQLNGNKCPVYATHVLLKATLERIQGGGDSCCWILSSKSFSNTLLRLESMVMPLQLLGEDRSLWCPLGIGIIRTMEESWGDMGSHGSYHHCIEHCG